MLMHQHISQVSPSHRSSRSPPAAGHALARGTVGDRQVPLPRGQQVDRAAGNPAGDQLRSRDRHRDGRRRPDRVGHHRLPGRLLLGPDRSPVPGRGHGRAGVVRVHAHGGQRDAQREGPHHLRQQGPGDGTDGHARHRQARPGPRAAPGCSRRCRCRRARPASSAHWSAMVQCKPGQPCEDRLPGTKSSLEDFLAICDD